MVPVKIVVDHIKDTPHSFHFDEPVSSFPLLADIQGDISGRITGSVQGDITVTREYENFRVVARINAPLALSCSRCLTEYPSFIDTSFTVFFRKENVKTPVVDNDLELGEMDLLYSVFSGDEIDMTHEIEEQCAMEMPVKPLCSDSCKGLCHTCGTDLNVSLCVCSKEPVGMAFSALKNFKVTS
jgi:uncharacterized protein